MFAQVRELTYDLDKLSQGQAPAVGGRRGTGAVARRASRRGGASDGARGSATVTTPEPAVGPSLLAAARDLAPGVVADRRTIHQQPELAFQEHRTAALVATRLEELGLEVRTGVAETGVIGLLRGGRPGRTVLLRADMDALPIQEESDAPYASQAPGVMHACGHDAHTAMLLGAARLLTARREQLPGDVKFMFQPAEETGHAGALRMLEHGVLEHPAVDAAFALHVESSRRVGLVEVRSGPSQASSDLFTITIRGRGGHAAFPHRTVDPLVVAAQVLTALQTLVSREVPPGQPAVVTVGSLTGGTTHNVIPDEAVLKGTVRAFDPQVRDLLEERIGELAQGIARGMRASADVVYQRGYPPLVNDAAMAALAAGVCRDLLGAGAVVHPDEPLMAAEDFAFVLERVPGALCGLGVMSSHLGDPPERPLAALRHRRGRAAHRRGRHGGPGAALPRRWRSLTRPPGRLPRLG